MKPPTSGVAPRAEVQPAYDDSARHQVYVLAPGLSGQHGAGSHDVTWDPGMLENGVYYCRLRAGVST